MMDSVCVLLQSSSRHDSKNNQLEMKYAGVANF